MTNVPTPLLVDTLATFDELAEPLRALLPVHDGALRLAAANGETVGERQLRRWVDDLAEIGLLNAGSYEPRAGVPYEPADESTLTRVQVLHGDSGVEAALQRRFGEYLREVESLADWLGWARRNLAVTGEAERWATADSDGAPPG